MRKILFTVVAYVAFVMPVSAQQAPVAELRQVGAYSEDARAARIVSYISQYRIVLSEGERQSVMANCKSAQVALTNIQLRLGATTTKRFDDYNLVVTKLNDLKLTMNTRLIDVSNLDLLIVDYKQLRNSFNDAVATFDTTLDDSIRMDCKSNPEGFRATLEAVREARKDTVVVSTEIKELTNSNLKTTLDTVRTKLEVSDGAQ